MEKETPSSGGRLSGMPGPASLMPKRTPIEIYPIVKRAGSLSLVGLYRDFTLELGSDDELQRPPFMTVSRGSPMSCEVARGSPKTI